MSQSAFLKHRQIAENRILQLMMDLDNGNPKGWNVQYWMNKMSKMSNKEFIEFMKELENEELDNKLYYQVNHLSDEKAPEVEDVFRIAKKYNIPLEEYIIMPEENRENPDVPSISKNKELVFILPVRKHQQTKDHKNKISNNNNKINQLTGQSIDDSKAARFSDNEMFSLNATGQINSIKEFLGPRGDDLIAQKKMEKEIQEHGHCSLKSLNMKPTDKQSIRTLITLLNAAGLDVRL